MSQEEINLSDYGTVIVLRRPVEVMLKGKVYVIPTGFESDGLSVPKRFWKVIAPPLNKQTLSSAWVAVDDDVSKLVEIEKELKTVQIELVKMQSTMLTAEHVKEIVIDELEKRGIR